MQGPSTCRECRVSQHAGGHCWWHAGHGAVATKAAPDGMHRIPHRMGWSDACLGIASIICSCSR